MTKRTNFCSIIRAIGRKLNGDAEELSLELFLESFRGEIVSGRCPFRAGKCGLGDRGRRAAAAFQILRAPKLHAFRPGALSRTGVLMLDF